jgi:nitrilase
MSFYRSIIDLYLMKKSITCVQIQPVFLDPLATATKICSYIEKASKREPNLVVFPELVLSGYPNFKIATNEYRNEYIRAAISVTGPELEQIAKTAENFGVVTVLGFIELDPDFPEVIYDSSCIIDSDGELLGTHRKIAPFGVEKLIFKEGDAKDIRVFDTNVGKLGIGLCFEHLNPLYRRALTLLGEEIHCALWVTSEDTKHIVDCSSKITAIENGVFVALVSQVTFKNSGSIAVGQNFIGGSGILDPLGRFVSGPIYGREETLYVEIEPEPWQTQKLQSRGIDARDDLLSLNLATEEYRSLYTKNPKKVDIRTSYSIINN